MCYPTGVMTRLYKYRTQLLLARRLDVVKLGTDDYGVYASGQRGEYGTSLMARGTEREVVDLLVGMGVNFNMAVST